MYTKQPKKLLIFNILDILRKYTDADHRLNQKEIGNILEREYDMKAERKAIRRNLLDLVEFGYEIEYSESLRMVLDPKTGELEESAVLSDFYLNRTFTNGELRLLTDSLLFSRHIPYSQCKELVKKLEGLSSIYFRSGIRHISKIPEDRTDNRQLFLNIELLDEAIDRARKVSFQYFSYGTDKKQHPRLRSDGSSRYTVSPYQMAAKEGKYYLICNLEKYDDISNYRLDRIRNLQILDELAVPFSSLQGAKGEPLDLEDYMKKHVYMYAGGDRRVKLRIEKSYVSDVMDLFGSDVRFSEETDTHVSVSVCTNEMSAEQFAKSFAPDVLILEPADLREKVKLSLEKAAKAYQP